jgi:hypothetical protein
MVSNRVSCLLVHFHIILGKVARRNQGRDTSSHAAHLEVTTPSLVLVGRRVSFGASLLYFAAEEQVTGNFQQLGAAAKWDERTPPNSGTCHRQVKLHAATPLTASPVWSEPPPLRASWCLSSCLGHLGSDMVEPLAIIVLTLQRGYPLAMITT